MQDENVADLGMASAEETSPIPEVQKLASDFSKLINCEEYSDLSVKFSGDASEDEPVHLHRCVLFCRTPSLLKVRKAAWSVEILSQETHVCFVTKPCFMPCYCVYINSDCSRSGQPGSCHSWLFCYSSTGLARKLALIGLGARVHSAIVHCLKPHLTFCLQAMEGCCDGRGVCLVSGRTRKEFLPLLEYIYSGAVRPGSESTIDGLVSEFENSVESCSAENELIDLTLDASGRKPRDWHRLASVVCSLKVQVMFHRVASFRVG